jgi:hypothetical protein
VLHSLFGLRSGSMPICVKLYSMLNACHVENLENFLKKGGVNMVKE